MVSTVTEKLSESLSFTSLAGVFLLVIVIVAHSSVSSDCEMSKNFIFVIFFRNRRTSDASSLINWSKSVRISLEANVSWRMLDRSAPLGVRSGSRTAVPLYGFPGRTPAALNTENWSENWVASLMMLIEAPPEMASAKR